MSIWILYKEFIWLNIHDHYPTPLGLSDVFSTLNHYLWISYLGTQVINDIILPELWVTKETINQMSISISCFTLFAWLIFSSNDSKFLLLCNITWINPFRHIISTCEQLHSTFLNEINDNGYQHSGPGQIKYPRAVGT